jgi:NAD(P)-dependent dehydrogenase (short-subunit alcohol dehydrogenase family)
MTTFPSQPFAPAALITGGARRIGRHITMALARAGYGVVVQVHHSRQAAEDLLGDIAGTGVRMAVVEADLADHDSVAGLVPAACAAIGPLTLLVNNAAEFEPDEIGHLDRDRFDRHFAVNLRAPVFLAEAFAEHAPAGRDASIVNLLDQRIYRPTPRFLSYGLTKSALHAATVTLAQALAPRIRVNGIAPGPTLPSSRQDAASFARQTRSVPLGHGPAPEEIAAAVVYLASAPSVTGVTIAVDGGQHLAWRTVAAEVSE